jgi:hypothetical protein
MTRPSSRSFSPEFLKWFKGASESVRKSDGTPKRFYRGQKAGSGELQSRFVMDSFTDIPAVASVYSSTKQGEVFREGSNVVAVFLAMKNPLVFEFSPSYFLVFYDLLTSLGYWSGKGITHEESVKILNFLAKRDAVSQMLFVQPGLKSFEGMPGFAYQLRDSSALEDDEIFVEWGLSFTQTPIQQFRDAWQNAEDDSEDDRRQLSLLFAADTYALVETPAFKRALEKLGYDGVIYEDPITVPAHILQAVAGTEDIDELPGVMEAEEDDDWKDLNVSRIIVTYRPLGREQVWFLTRASGDRPNPRRRLRP